MKERRCRQLGLFAALFCACALFLSNGFVKNSVNAYAATYSADDIVKYALEAASRGDSYAGQSCMSWVNGAFQAVYGFPRLGCCGYTYGQSVKVSSSLDNIPLGAIVYFQYDDNRTLSKTRDTIGCGEYAGHIGIYVGDGQMVHTFDWFRGDGTRVRKNYIYELNKPGLYKYLGWGWYNHTELSSGSPKAETAQIVLDANGGSIVSTAGYTEWSDVRTTTTKPVESDLLKITGTETKKQYKYFHFHNNYSGYANMIDSISYTGNWGYCEIIRDTPFSESRSFQDKGGRTFVKIGDGCQYGYTYWFEDIITTTIYSYVTREKVQNVGSEFSINLDGIIPVLPRVEKNGSNFLYWNTKADGSGKKLYPGTDVEFGKVSANSSYVLYAIYEKGEPAQIILETNGGYIVSTIGYSEWSEVKTTTTKPTESDLLKITDTTTKEQYKYFHYHNSYDGTDKMLDSISYWGNWEYCEIIRDTPFTDVRSFKDKGGRTYIKLGDYCQYGYNYWFEDTITSTVYSYVTRTKDKNVGSTININLDGIIPVLPEAEKSGCTFLYWNTKADGTGKTFYPGADVKFGTVSANSCYILYAIFSDDIGKINDEKVDTNSDKEIKISAPKASKISKLKAGDDSFTVNWKKISQGNTGYQIQYSTSKKFAKSKTKTINVNSPATTSTKITKLKSGKKYYVRVRTYYILVTDGKEQIVYSGWSDSKSIKTK